MEYTILCRGCTLADVKAYIESSPGASLQWRDQDWRVSYGFGEETYLDIMYLVDLNEAEQFAAHKQPRIIHQAGTFEAFLAVIGRSAGPCSRAHGPPPYPRA